MFAEHLGSRGSTDFKVFFVIDLLDNGIVSLFQSYCNINGIVLNPHCGRTKDQSIIDRTKQIFTLFQRVEDRRNAIEIRQLHT